MGRQKRGKNMSDPKKDELAYKDEQPGGLVQLPAYYIARYPVTVEQFRVFVEDSGLRPTYPDCLRGIPNHPRMGCRGTSVRPPNHTDAGTPRSFAGR